MIFSKEELLKEVSDSNDEYSFFNTASLKLLLDTYGGKFKNDKQSNLFRKKAAYSNFEDLKNDNKLKNVYYFVKEKYYKIPVDSPTTPRYFDVKHLINYRKNICIVFDRRCVILIANIITGEITWVTKFIDNGDFYHLEPKLKNECKIFWERTFNQNLYEYQSVAGMFNLKIDNEKLKYSLKQFMYSAMSFKENKQIGSRIDAYEYNNIYNDLRISGDDLNLIRKTYINPNSKVNIFMFEQFIPKYLERVKYQVFDISKLENDLRFFNSTGYLRGKFNNKELLMKAIKFMESINK